MFNFFPNESVHTYFVPYKKKNGFIRPNRGKLWDRYSNVRKDLRKLNNILKEFESIINTTDIIVDQGSYIIILLISVPIK